MAFNNTDLKKVDAEMIETHDGSEDQRDATIKPEGSPPEYSPEGWYYPSQKEY